jgi:RHS repeat-associated protein
MSGSTRSFPAANVWRASNLAEKTRLTPGNVWFNGEPLAQIETATGTIHYYFNDHLGAPLLTTNSTGAIDWRVEREPYGAIFATRVGAERHQPLSLPGQEYDPNQPERAYNVFRWYRSSWGRYGQADPIGLTVGSSTHLYSYVDGRPTFARDRLGLVSSAADCPQGVCCTPAAMKQELDKAWQYALMHQKDYDWSLEGSCTGESCGTMADKLRWDIERHVQPKCFITSTQLTKGGFLGRAVNAITQLLFGIHGWVHYVVKFTPCNADLTPQYIDLYTHPNRGPLPPSDELDQP